MSHSTLIIFIIKSSLPQPIGLQLDCISPRPFNMLLMEIVVQQEFGKTDLTNHYLVSWKRDYGLEISQC